MLFPLCSQARLSSCCRGHTGGSALGWGHTQTQGHSPASPSTWFPRKRCWTTRVLCSHSTTSPRLYPIRSWLPLRGCSWMDSTGPSAFPQRYSSGTLRGHTHGGSERGWGWWGWAMGPAGLSPLQDLIREEGFVLQQRQGGQGDEVHGTTLGAQAGHGTRSHGQDHCHPCDARGAAGGGTGAASALSWVWGASKRLQTSPAPSLHPHLPEARRTRTRTASVLTAIRAIHHPGALPAP